MRPRRVGMRVIALPQDAIDADVVPSLDADALVDEAHPDVATEDVGGALVVHARPVAVTLPLTIGALERERHPPDAALRQRELDIREAARDAAHDQVHARHPRSR